MAVKIRLTRKGSKKRPFYRIVAADSQAPRDGSFLEVLGTYDPMADPAGIELKKDRVTYWLEQGALPTGTVKQILKKAMEEVKAA